MKKIVINKCFGGFSISLEAAKFMAKRGNKQAKEEIKIYEKEKQWFGFGYSNQYKEQYSRTDPDLILVIETLKDKASGNGSKLTIVKIPNNIEWEITEYDGIEKIEEKHKSWS